MAISINSLRRVKADKPPRTLIYGNPGIGKTTLASEFPNPVFLQVEDGTPDGVELSSFGMLKTFDEVMQSIGVIYENHAELGFQTVVLDSVTAMQRLVFAETCERGDEHGNRKKNIEDFGYGKGYVKASQIWQEFIEGVNALRDDKGMAVVFIAHSHIERFDDPESVSYDRYDIDIHDKIRGAIEREMDAIILLKNKVSIQEEDHGFNKKRAVAKGGSTVWMHANPKPAYVAKNRYGIEDTTYVRGGGFAYLSKFFPAWAAEDALTLSQQADAA